MASKGKAPPPLRSRPPPDSPPFMSPLIPLESLILTEPPERPSPSFKSRSSMNPTILLPKRVPDLCLQSSGVEVSIFLTFGLVFHKGLVVFSARHLCGHECNCTVASCSQASLSQHCKVLSTGLWMLIHWEWVYLPQSLIPVLVYGVHLAQRRSQSQGKAKEANKVLLLHQDRVRQAPRSHPDTAWNKDRLTPGLGWVFLGPSLETPFHGLTVEIFISSPHIAEAIAIRSPLSMELTLEFFTLRIFFDSLTLIRAISRNLQSKEVIGIVKDIRSISSGFAAIYCYHVCRSDNLVTKK
ncbi:hypothetical protein F2Q70_00007890 [Brassica cretica]|uniref:RNase H type-1 domain-containing protein n=1 Tax=Brassica cretica TaxID=69181 RepID=A0A8S9M7G6_BRACR|nr:hypothetical protein F2Q70_00007890 [Brassica cretica]